MKILGADSCNSKRLIIGFTLCFLSNFIMAQGRSYGLVYSENIKGGTAMFGNTLLNIVKSDSSVNLVKMNDNSANGNSTYGNDNENMQYVDIDSTTGFGASTRNSSSSDLVLPAGNNTIRLARLYWGGRVKNSDFNLGADSNQVVKIRKGTLNAYSNVRALAIDSLAIVPGYTQYQAYADITTLVQNNGAGTYEVGNAPLSTGSIASGGNNGGWCIFVVYENAALNYNSIRIYDGFEQVYSNGSPLSTTVTLTGLNIPSGALGAGDAKMGVLAWEGDANIMNDYLKINDSLFSNATNQANNPWNGTITDNGIHVTTKNPNYTNQMGVDIDQFDVGTGYNIQPNATSVTLEFGTENDKYYPGLFTFTVKMKDPIITLNKTVSDANNDHLGEANEVLTYTLKGANTGTGNASNVIVTDTLPSTVTYVPNSLKIINAPGCVAGTTLTDATGDDIAEYIVNGSVKTVVFRLGAGATASAGGSLAANDTYQVQFQVTVNDPGKGNHVPSIMNIARIKAQSDAGVNFADDGTAIINPDNGPLPVTMVSFNAALQPDNKVKVSWATSMEINCDSYKIERSLDGNIFLEIANVKGNGTTSILHNYFIIDDVSAATSPVIYYRIKQVDLDGKASYSIVVSVRIKNNGNNIIISPNPFSSYLNINMDWKKKESIIARIINVQGKEMLSKNILMNKGLNYISINGLSWLPAGNYFLQFISETEKMIQKITKQ